MSLPPRPATAEPSFAVTIDWSRAPAVGTAFGVSLVSAAIAVSAMHARESGDLDLSNFITGVLATVGLLGLAAAAHLLLPESEARAALVSWPGAAGAVGAGAMVGVLIDDDPAAAYVGALVVMALSVGGYLATRTWPFVVGTIVGLAVVYMQLFEDVIDFDGDGTNVFMIVGAAILMFVIAVTLGGWLLPATRILSGVLVGAGGLLAMVAVLQGLMVFGAFEAFASSSGEVFSEEEFTTGGDAVFEEDFPDVAGLVRDNPYQDDVYVILGYCAILVLLWAGCALVTGHIAFRVLIASSAVLVVPLATVALYVNHPTWWSVGLGAIGAVLLTGVAFWPRPRALESAT